jgi:hypothetical protein
MADPVPLTQYVEVYSDKVIQGPTDGGYAVLFDTKIATDGWKEVRVGVHVFVINYATTPITQGANLLLRFMHDFAGGDSFDYEANIIPFTTASYIDGYAVKPIIGKELRLLCHPTQMPPGPYNMSVTYLLVR